MNSNQVLKTLILAIALISFGCNSGEQGQTTTVVNATATSQNTIKISRSDYKDRLYGFWLAQCIANWTGLVTEMDKVGNIGEFQTGNFYTREDWGQPDQPSIWGQGIPSNLSPTIDFVYAKPDSIWGADDDTDIEYMYQHLLHTNQTTLLTGRQIADGWLKHIKHEEENFLWVSNQRALDLMIDSVLPPATSDPANNEHYEMIDAQLTTEIFGLFAPGRPDIAVKMAHLPIQTTARFNAEWISKFYVTMYSLTAIVDASMRPKDQIHWMAEQARKVLPDTSYSAKMYDFVKMKYDSGNAWETTRDAIYQRYQVEQADGYDITSRDLYCNGCFAGGINFAASIVSLFYGEGDLKETIKIGALAGWDSDNPTATWAGMIGSMIGQKGVEDAFGMQFADEFNIHRTRVGFPNDGIDTFDHMTEVGVEIIDQVVVEQMDGKIDSISNSWILPKMAF